MPRTSWEYVVKIKVFDQEPGTGLVEVLKNSAHQVSFDQSAGQTEATFGQIATEPENVSWL